MTENEAHSEDRIKIKKSPPIESEIPTPEDFFLKIGLYEKIVFYDDEKEYARLRTIRYFRDAIDSYCPFCNRHSIFRNQNEETGGSASASDITRNQIYSIALECSRNEAHLLFFIFKVFNKTIQKIGQYPSVADLQLEDTAKYKDILEQQKHGEFKRAIGLFAHGIGIGSFVYLRRIFESLIEEGHEKARVEGLDDDRYLRARMSEKIKMLKDYLPEFLVENSKIYEILSKGIHELEENECLKYFPIVKAGIELILDEKLEKLERQRKEESTKKEIQKAGIEIKNGIK